MSTTQDEFLELFDLVPDWARLFEAYTKNGGISHSTVNWETASATRSEVTYRFLEKLGPRTIYQQALLLGPRSQRLLKITRDHYLIKVAATLLARNPTLRRYFLERRIDKESQSNYVDSLAAELALKLDDALHKKLAGSDADGFKVLLPAYIQSSANNAVIDLVKQESSWEKRTLQDMSFDGEQEDPRETSPDDVAHIPENIVLSKEKVRYLNELRAKLEQFFKSKQINSSAAVTEKPAEPSLLTVDCIFGLGLTKYSKPGVEMTMRECCERLEIAGETQARKIARCQVLLDKGLDEIRQLVQQEMPGLAEYRQREININNASRRELKHQLSLTEGEIERLIANRQFGEIGELGVREILKSDKLQRLIERGAVAFLIPVDLNSAPARDLIDILGLSKEVANSIVTNRPFTGFDDTVGRNCLDKMLVAKTVKNGAVLKPLRLSKTNPPNSGSANVEKDE
jgi:DNA uptake protein ComE-like DNA-binding protein